jgi:hypothetical protein
MTLRRLLPACLVVNAVLGIGLGAAWWRQRRVKAAWAARQTELRATQANAGALLRAIQRYESEHARPPATLTELVPGYLPRLPDPGPVARNGWSYRVGARPDPEWEPPPDQPWSLGVQVRSGFCPACGFSFGDYFAYHPTGRYPRAAYGGILERIGGWGYYHE